MPTYQYVCTDCDEPLEVVQSFSDDALTECPTCGGRLRKVYGSVGVVFKGSGFYRNDSRSTASSSEKAGSSANPSKSSESTSTSESSTKSDSSSTSTPASAPSTSTPSAAPATT